MRKAFAVLAVFAAMAVTPAFAFDCTNRSAYPIAPPTWDYVGNPLDTSASDCWTLGSSEPTWNSTAHEWQFSSYPSQTATRVINVPSTDTGSTSWNAQLWVDFNDPHAEWWQFLGAKVDVNHGGVHTIYTIYNNHGSNVAVDSGIKSVNFTAVSGDTITITVTGQNAEVDSVVRFSSVHVFRPA